MKNILSTLALLLIYSTVTRSQNIEKESPLSLITTHKMNSNWYRFDKGVKPTKENLNSVEMKQYFEMDNNNSFQCIKSDTDDLRIIHHSFQQVYKGYPVQFAIFKIHEFKDKTIEGNGHYVPRFNKDIPTIISFNEAFNFAKQYFPSEKYMWQDSMEELSLRKRSRGKFQTYMPKEELIWAVSTHHFNDFRVSNYTLAYKMTISSSQPSFSKVVYIDAQSGKLLNALDLEHNCGNHSFTTNFNGTKSVAYYSSISSFDKLVDSCGVGDIIYTSDNQSAINPYLKFAGSAWPNTNNFNSAATSMWALREAEKYYYNIHSRPGWDSSGFDVDLRQNAIFYSDVTLPLDSPYYRNASFNGGTGICKVGNNESGGPNGVNTITSDDINSIDVLAHEMTHGVTYSTAGLVYSGESGALNESFSDIFGINTYQYVGGYSAGNLWKIGYDMTDVNGIHQIFRDMQNPHSKGDPNTYLTDAFWFDTTATAYDYGGVHRNSGVQNYMYYLLVTGGSGTNANGLAYSISGIGFAQARLIAYRALTVGYLNATSNHVEARDAWVHAAVDLYGNCSTQSQAVGKAWEAVGVGSYWYYGNNICGTKTGYVVNQSNSPYFISPSNCATTITGNGLEVRYDGGDFVNISPGFNTSAGAFFTARTNQCFYSNY